MSEQPENIQVVIEEPVVEVPVIDEAVAEEPVVEVPVVEEPVVEEPVVEEPVVEEPVVEEPVVEVPVVEVPVVEEPVVEEPVVEEPVVEEPVVQEPVVEEPVVEEPVVEEPVVEEPVVEVPVVEEPVVEEPVVEEPVVEEPVVEEPVVEEPVVEEPVVEEPVVEEPVVEEPVVEEPVVEEPVDPNAVPKIVFIIPYRDREQQQRFFSKHMEFILEDKPKSEYKIYYVHQTDNRAFNRGALKNIGFLYVKEKYPNDYKNITLVFNDVDTMPYTKNFLDYETSTGIVKHFYGFDYTLGGIVSITGWDFEKVSGFPNFWAWGYEDNMFQIRVRKANIIVDRSNFYPLMDKNIFQMKDSLIRLVNRGEFDRFMANTPEGFQSITDLSYDVDEKSGFIHVKTFNTGTQENAKQTVTYDIRNGTVPFKTATIASAPAGRRRPMMSMRL